MRPANLIRYAALLFLMLPLWANALVASFVAADDHHTCVVTTAGGVQCWGDNAQGQLGDGTTTQRLTPVEVYGLGSGGVQLAAGSLHTCALTTAGGVKCWGYNSSGTLGDGTTTRRLTPSAVVGLSSGSQAIAAGAYQTCALTTAGGVKCWGSNDVGQLGDGTVTNRLTPVAVVGLSSDVRKIAAGYSHTCALTTAGGVKCWGYNGAGMLGDGTVTDRLTPVAVVGLSSGVQAIAGGQYHTCALTTAGGVQCWGYSAYGALGYGGTLRQLTPVAVVGLSSGVQALAVGGSHTCALTTAGGVKCWGRNDYGQLGDGTVTNRLTPVAVVGLSSGVQALAAGFSHTCAVMTAGGVKCWGWNTQGQLGDGTTMDRLTPVAVANGVQSISVTTAAPASGIIGVSFPVAASSSSGLPVAISVTGGCSISGNNITLTSATPFCTVNYNQAGNTEYLAAAQVSSITYVDTDGDGVPDVNDTAPLNPLIGCSAGNFWNGSVCTVVSVCGAGKYQTAAATLTTNTQCATSTPVAHCTVYAPTVNACTACAANYNLSGGVCVFQDADGDAVADALDNCPAISNADQANTDGDAFGNVCDTDDDNDTVLDGNDNCPLNANADQADFDNDLLPDACTDTDDDNDGELDSVELQQGTDPLNSASNSSLLTVVSFENAGVPVGWIKPSGANGNWSSVVAQSVHLSRSLRSAVISNSSKAQLQTTINIASPTFSFYVKTSTEVNDVFSVYVDNVSQATRSGIADWELIIVPVTPGVHTIKFEYLKNATAVAGSDMVLVDKLVYLDGYDTDGDGIINVNDLDDDNDGVADVSDAFPLNAAESVDTDSDGTGNNADTDDDNDGVADVSDAFPLNSAESVDTDSDGTGNNADTDDDNDGYSDVDEVAAGSDPLNAGSVPYIVYPLDGVYKGSVISDQSAPL